MTDFCASLVRQTHELADVKDELWTLHKAVDRPSDLSFTQWLQLYAIVHDFKPDVIVELGRGRGNSTCVFTTAVHRLNAGKVVSIGNDSTRDWERITLPRIIPLATEDWFARLTVLQQDVMETDLSRILDHSRRAVLFWDVHGVEVANSILSRMLPALIEREHLIIVHDMTDTRYSDIDRSYSLERPPPIWMGAVSSSDPEIIAIYDFISRNELRFDTPGDSIARFVKSRPNDLNDDVRKLVEFWKTLDPDGDVYESHWLYFDMNTYGKERTVSFPDKSSGIIDIITIPELWAIKQRFRKNLDEVNRFHPERLSFGRVVFKRQGANFVQSLERNSYGNVKKEDLLFQNGGRCVLLASSPRDHVCTHFFETGGLHPTDKNWVRITLWYPDKTGPGRNSIVQVQNKEYEIVWTLPFIELDLAERQFGGYVDIGHASSIRVTFETLDGRPTYLPYELKVEGLSRV